MMDINRPKFTLIFIPAEAKLKNPELIWTKKSAFICTRVEKSRANCTQITRSLLPLVATVHSYGTLFKR